MKNILILICACFISIASVFGQDDVKLELKEGQKPVVIIDGKRYDHSIIELLDQSKIESVMIFKDAEAKEKYDAPDGVIIIMTKEASKEIESEELNIAGPNGKDPLIIINGKVRSKEELEKISPDDIESINVLKGQNAIDQYEAPNGVIIVNLKKK